MLLFFAIEIVVVRTSSYWSDLLEMSGYLTDCILRIERGIKRLRLQRVKCTGFPVQSCSVGFVELLFRC
jgi:hypothetical protein